ncbi:uncharacterized protein EI97DRAFT_456945 [Westerdykella ornata]|uniref:Uncharacterized protein n=1 Tax=Westerdykella ornata TaxID=318751 RepID=A0A6A6JPM1_WESOR|nr:uncharacterized protein EI97DRAFT_456945 [Westerdykella ornata]KAF2278561.1 hypothetical protein EI97DRAFT_456945 [Westerdykella ornata]
MDKPAPTHLSSTTSAPTSPTFTSQPTLTPTHTQPPLSLQKPAAPPTASTADPHLAQQEEATTRVSTTKPYTGPPPSARRKSWSHETGTGHGGEGNMSDTSLTQDPGSQLYHGHVHVGKWNRPW